VLERRTTRCRFLIGAGVVALGAAGLAWNERRSVNETRIAIAIWDGVEELDFAGPYEVLTAWGAYSDGAVTVNTVGETLDTVRCSHGLKVIPDVAWSQVDGLDVFVLPGGNSSVQLENDAFLERVRRLAAAGTLMTSVCTGALVYAKAGLLDGRPATTHWGSLESLAAYGNGIRVDPASRFVDDGDVITAAGVSAGIDMALHLVARLESVERSRDVKRYIQYEGG
jgi:transcriptional regulator GlxA family with amidase domain